jgi:hypothetical protein
MKWSELQADGPAHEVFKIGPIDGSDLNPAAPMGHKPETDHALWFPISEAELAYATVEQVDPLLYFYAIGDPKRLNKRFNQDSPLNEKRAALLLFLAGRRCFPLLFDRNTSSLHVAMPQGSRTCRCYVVCAVCS